MTRYCVFALLAALPSTGFAQTDDTAYCNKGRTATAIPYLEKRLRDNHITVPPR